MAGLRVLNNPIEEEGSASSSELVGFLTAISDAESYKAQESTTLGFIITFDIPRFEIHLLDELSRMRLDPQLHCFNVLAVKVPRELSLLSRIDVATFIDRNQVSLRFYVLGTFVTLKFKFSSSNPQFMNEMMDAIHRSNLSTAVTFVDADKLDEMDTRKISQQISRRRIFNVIKCNSQNLATKMTQYDSFLKGDEYVG
ncbi:hypothetical protein TUMSATVNIG1_60860 (plasmid) [Vibrio nigripulchritudo]|uniref:hypothetical protein n=1 Tax=Vibrio nigripulchritudo TaxID=28173 RepID=UPI00190C4776|nr:hypothetical protein [Vibrio nigripulchritudo]BCL74102.1 hypothetical protein VNTUMSATTG_60390 [Vibrio nigripulchritudo]BDU35477.1 hypothetical protein TUMSATVNIG1_60860 [Vibrio nigripulchritudo]